MPAMNLSKPDFTILPSSHLPPTMCQKAHFRCSNQHCRAVYTERVYCQSQSDTGCDPEKCINFDHVQFSPFPSSECVICEAVVVAEGKAAETAAREELKKEAKEGIKRSKSIKGFLTRVFK
jgi:hypothetical protein